MENNIMVSICCLAYNHEKYIKKTLDGFINQKTNFKYEILIHDDCSSDNTVKIIEEYKQRYPDLIKPIYQTENQFSKGIRVSFTYQYSRAKGKYIALCEGDDYWTDSNKLQLQFNAMENNSDCTLCTHIVQHMDESGNYINKIQPTYEFKEGIMSKNDFFNNIFLSEIMPFQTSSFFFKKIDVIKYKNTFLKKIDEIKDFGDVPLSWYLLLNGNCYFIDKIMSNYRENSISSWSNRLKNSSYLIKHCQDIILFLNKFNYFSKYIYNDSITYIVKKYEFSILWIREDFKKMIDSDYKEIFKKCSISDRIKIFIYGFFPFTRKIVNNMKNKK